MAQKRVALIGSGPSGMSVLYNLEKLRKKGVDVPEVICFEKQDNWGGLWNYTWRTGIDQHGETVHGSMYRYLWSNGPKEALEFPDYTFEEHFGKAIPSFPPREVLFDYLQGRWKKFNLRRYVKFGHAVRNVVYNPIEDKFAVVVKNLDADVTYPPEKFDYVINCSGHFSVPNMPAYPGVEKFQGRVLHAHDFRDAREFTGKRLLLIGSSYSAEDIGLQCVKYGAESVICSYRTNPMGFDWPTNFTEKPILLKVEGNTATFKDGSTAEVDAIIMCTGYKHHYPYLEDSLRLTGANLYVLENMYKGVVWLKGGNNKFLYVGAQDQFYTFTMFDMQGLWAMKYITGQINLPDRDLMDGEIKQWMEKQNAMKDYHDEIDIQTEYVVDLAKDNDYDHDLDVAAIFNGWEDDKHKNILTYRDISFASKFTGTQSPVHHTPFMKALDDSMACFLATK